MVKINLYNHLMSLVEAPCVFSSITQESSEDNKTHTFVGTINNQGFNITETGGKKTALDKIAREVFTELGIEESADPSSLANTQKMKFILQSWSPTSVLRNIARGIRITFEKEENGKFTLSASFKRTKDGESEELGQVSAGSIPDAEHELAVQILATDEELKKRHIEKVTNRAAFQRRAKVPWDDMEDIEADDSEYCTGLATFCETSGLEPPQYKKGDDGEKVLCKVRITATNADKEQASAQVLAKVQDIIKTQNASAEYYKKQQEEAATASATPQLWEKMDDDVDEAEDVETDIYTAETIKQAAGEDAVKFPILALNDYCRADATLDAPAYASRDSSGEVGSEVGYVVQCVVSHCKANGFAKTKKEAKQVAAQAMLVTLKNCGDAPKVEKVKTESAAPPATPPADQNPISAITQAGQYLGAVASWQIDDGTAVGTNSKIFTANATFGELSMNASGGNKKDAKTNCARQLLAVIDAKHVDWRVQMAAKKSAKRSSMSRGGRGGKFAKV